MYQAIHFSSYLSIPRSLQQNVMDLIVTPETELVKTSYKFGQLCDEVSDNIYGLSFIDELEMEKVLL